MVSGNVVHFAGGDARGRSMRQQREVAELLRPFVGLSPGLDRQLVQAHAAKTYADAFANDAGEWFFRLDRGAKRARFDLIGAFAESSRAVEALARRGARSAVNHCLRHPQAYVRHALFRQQTLEVARLDGLLRRGASGPHPVANHAWSSGGMHASESWPGPVSTFDLREHDWQRVAPRSQAALDQARADAYLGRATDRESLLELGSTYPMLVLTSLLAHGLAQPARELLASGCLLPRLVVEYGVAPAADVAYDSDGLGTFVDLRVWTSRRSPLAACLRGGGWHPRANYVETAALLLAADVRPSLRQRYQLRWAYRRRETAPAARAEAPAAPPRYLTWP